MYRYAQIDSNGYIVSDSYLSGEVTADNMIPISEDFDLSNKKYVDGSWVEYTPEPATEVLAEEQEIMYENQSNIEMTLCLLELQSQ